jgi:hypothetical protein
VIFENSIKKQKERKQCQPNITTIQTSSAIQSSLFLKSEARAGGSHL